MPEADPVIAVTRLTKSFAGRPAVSALTIHLERGGFLGLVGANGGGKTTTLRMLAGLVVPDGGSGHVLGGDIRKHGPPRQRLGYMVQRNSLTSELTVHQTLRFHAVMHGLADPATRIAEVVEQFGLDQVLAQRCGLLSGGWARRVQLAATLLPQPELLLLDEPTAGIDALNRHLIWQWLRQLASAGTSVVISTHDLTEAERCPQIVLYDAGRTEGPMPPSALLAQSSAASLEAAVLARSRT
jgi:ABC-2 type transport system ATP-binding protein